MHSVLTAHQPRMLPTELRGRTSPAEGMKGHADYGQMSQDQMKGLLEICDPAGTGLVSIQYLATLAAQHYKTKEEAEKVVGCLDPKGRGVLSYREFCLGVTTILRQAAGRGEISGVRREKAADLAMTPPNEDHLQSVPVSPEPESFESYGEFGHTVGPGGDNAQKSPNGNTLKRDAWGRRSLRTKKADSNKTGSLPNRGWGSFRQTPGKRPATSNNSPTQLYRTSSFNSSGRSSTCDNGEDIYSDISLEDDFVDLNHKVQMLQQQMNVLADSQNQSDERYTRAKQDNATLQARIHMLEEHMREVEIRAEEKLAEEERRHRELVARVDREKLLEVENCNIRLQTLETSNRALVEEANRSKGTIDKMRLDLAKQEDASNLKGSLISALRDELVTLKESERRNKDKIAVQLQLIDELSVELEKTRGAHSRALAELSAVASNVSEETHNQLQDQLVHLRNENLRLQDAHDEMQAMLLTKRLEEGHTLIGKDESLAAELHEMSQEEGDSVGEEHKLREKLREQQEELSKLKAYIDNILLNIIENSPQLLEVRSKTV